MVNPGNTPNLSIQAVAPPTGGLLHNSLTFKEKIYRSMNKCAVVRKSEKEKSPNLQICCYFWSSLFFFFFFTFYCVWFITWG